MAFRRQDIPKTTRKGGEGEPRRLYPRFAKDRSLLPKIELAIGYLDGMVGRRRGDLSPDVVLELFGDPKLARCLLACLADSYRYRTPEIADLVGEEAAGALAAWEILAPGDLRAHLYRAANEGGGGFVAPADRAAFMDEVGGPLGLTPAQVDDLVHLDAERNAVLIRVGPRPLAADVLARYNVVLALSVLRLASEVTLELPGLDAATVETVCSAWEVPCRRLGGETIRLVGRQSSMGSWSQFGARVARCAVHLLVLAPRTPSGRATVHLAGPPLHFGLDGFVVGALRPALRAVAGADGVVRSALLTAAVGALRRRVGQGTHGWTMRRALEPIVVEGAIVVPELVFTRDQLRVGLVPVGGERVGALAAAERAQAVTPFVVLGDGTGSELPAVGSEEAEALVGRLDELAERAEGGRTALAVLADELVSVGWVESGRLTEVLGEGDLAERVRLITDEGETAFVPGFGLCRVSLLDELLDRMVERAGALDVGAVRQTVADRVGGGAGADALTLHLLGRHGVLTGPISLRPDSAVEHAA